jgi:DNA-binding winged helix-turn-helix (wHTH) protein/tetratricopeptide (TPR) repeat protein
MSLPVVRAVTLPYRVRRYSEDMVVCFGPFELDPDRQELRRSGLLLRLPHQPARLLLLFVRRAGEVITREEIQQALWGSETHVDFEQGINAAIRQIRYHLGDNAEVPRYLKTVPRRGYVWIAPVEPVDPLPEPSEPPRGAAGFSPAMIRRAEARRSTRWPRLAVLSIGVVLLGALAAVGWSVLPRNRRTIAVAPFRSIGVVPPGIDPRAFTQELRSTVGALPRKHLMLVEEPSNGDAQVRLEGTIQRDGDSVRVIVSCIDTASRTQLWTAACERRIGEHSNMAMQAAHLVAHEVVHRFLPPPRHEPLLRTHVPPRVLEVYRRARMERRRSLPDPDGKRAEALFEQALAGEPRFAEALSGLADIWAQRAGTGSTQRKEAVARARHYARRALALQPDMAESRTALGLMSFQYDWDLSAAEQTFREAVESDPGYVDAHYDLCIVLVARGEFDAAVEEFEQARALDPIDFDLHPAEGMLYLRTRRYEEAVAKYREILRFRESVQSRWGILWVSAVRRDWDGAASILRPLLDLPPHPRGVLATEEEFRDLFRRTENIVLGARERGTFEHYHVAAYYSMRGDRDLAFAALGRAFAERSPTVPFLMVDPRFDGLRNDPRYTSLAARIR